MAKLAGVILAAGLGTRMKSDTVKVLHPVCGRPMLAYVIDALRGAGAERVIAVVGHQSERVKQVFGGTVEYAVQEKQLGTGHAVMQAKMLIDAYPGIVVVANGDAPLLRSETLERLVAYHLENGLSATVLTAVLANPTGYGRVIRDANGAVERIVEHKDASPAERAVCEINTGMYAFSGPQLFPALAQVGTGNVQGEFYLTDIIDILRRNGHKVGAMAVADAPEAMGVNDRIQLAEADRAMRERVLRNLMLAGVTIVDPSSTYIEPQVNIGRDTVVHPFTYLAGDTMIGEKCSLGPYCHIEKARLESGVQVGAATLIGCTIGAGARIGSYVSIEPGTVVPPSHIVRASVYQMGDEKSNGQ